MIDAAMNFKGWGSSIFAMKNADASEGQIQKNAAGTSYIKKVVLVIFIGLVFQTHHLDAQSGGAIIGPNGVPLKVITNQPCHINESWTEGSNSSPCEAFRAFYVLPVRENAPSRRLRDMRQLKKNGFYRIASGAGESEYCGWIHETFVEEWRSAQVLRFTPRGGRDLAHFFPTADQAREAILTGDLTKATHREPAGKRDEEIILMPLLETGSFSKNGNPTRLFRCAFMSGSPGAASRGRGGDAAPPGTSLQIVFVIDTTGSMAEPIKQVRKSLETVVKNLSNDSELRTYIHFGLVEYRDLLKNMNEMEYVARVRCDLKRGKNHPLFLQDLENLKLSEVGSGGLPEDVLAGVHRALGQRVMKWNPHGWKLIIVVGDSSIRELDHPDPDNRTNERSRTIDEIKYLAQDEYSGMPVGVVISAVRIEDPDNAEDNEIGAEQFKDLVAGKKYGGWIIGARGGSEPEDFSRKLTGKIADSIRNFREAILLGSGKKPEKRASAADFPFPVLDYIEKSKTGSPAAPGLRFSSRYATEFDSHGNRLFIPYIFARKGQLKSFLAFMEYVEGSLENAGEPGSRSLDQILLDLQSVSAMLNLGEPVAPSLSLEAFLRAIMEIPIKTPIFHMTLNRLAAMDDMEYEEWLEKVHFSKEKLETYLSRPIWFKLSPKAAEREEHAFIPLSDLP